jgi:cob(I)alamin adenosyltransferase
MTEPLTEFTAAFYAAIAGLLVVLITNITNKFINKEKSQLETHVTLRKELREELDNVRNELFRLQEELAEWREKYYHQVELTNSLKLDVLTLTDELNEYKRISGIHPTSDKNHNGWFDTDPDE